jgi:protein gp37
VDLTPWTAGDQPAALRWVIVGGESGPGARRMDLGWAVDIVGQCQRADVAVFVKQLGSRFGSHKGGDMDTWPAKLRVRAFPGVQA